MRITIVSGAFLPAPPLMGGATEKIQFALGREFARRDCEVNHISRLYADLPRYELKEGVNYTRIPGYDTPASLLKLKYLDLLYSLRVRRVLPPADILVTNTFWLPIVTRTQRYGNIYVSVRRYPKGQMRLYKHARRLQAVSNAVAEAIIEQSPECKSLVKTIPNPLPENWMEPPIDIGQVRENWILYVGRIHPEKGIDLLIDAFTQAVNRGLTGWRLVIVGPWETRYGGGGNDFHQRLIQRRETAASRIDWVGPVFEEEVLKRYYDRAALFVYPSLAERGEAFGLAPLEAMARGCIPIVSSLSCFRDFTQPDHNAFVFDHHTDDPVANLTEVLMKAVRLSPSLTQMRANAVQTARKFTLESVATEMLADFESLL